MIVADLPSRHDSDIVSKIIKALKPHRCRLSPSISEYRYSGMVALVKRGRVTALVPIIASIWLVLSEIKLGQVLSTGIILFGAIVTKYLWSTAPRMLPVDKTNAWWIAKDGSVKKYDFTFGTMRYYLEERDGLVRIEKGTVIKIPNTHGRITFNHDPTQADVQAAIDTLATLMSVNRWKRRKMLEVLAAKTGIRVVDDVAYRTISPGTVEIEQTDKRKYAKSK